MDIIEYVLTYKEEGSDTPVITIAEYYDRYVKPLSPAYGKYSFKTSNTVVCCFHDDVNPSLGTIKHKHLKGVRVYHCFGCGAAGTVVDMHRRIEREFHNRTLSAEESALELCTLFGVDASAYKDLDQSKLKQSAYMDKLRRIQKSMSVYTLRDFQDDIVIARRDDVALDTKISAVNMACVKMTATKKKLFDD